MKIESISFSNLPFPKLFQNYINQEQTLLRFYETNPFSQEDLQRKIDSYRYGGDRKELGRYLRDYNAQFGTYPHIEKSIKKLEEEDGLVVVTGQQLTIFGGPLFTVYKIATAIRKAREIEETYNRPVVPVFWLADEDHDYEEAAEFNLPAGEDIRRFFYDKPDNLDARVHEIPFDNRVDALIREIAESQFKTEFSPQVWDLLRKGYSSGKTFGYAFGTLIMNLFAEEGLILCGSNHRWAKEVTRDIFTESVSRKDAIYEALTRQTEALEKEGYSGQVQVQKSNLFLIDEKGNRNKLSAEDGHWVEENSGRTYSDSELTARIAESPEKFSPNVFLRPILQSRLLPDVVYVAGPGEVAYYAQLKPLYEAFNLPMPVILPRLSATIVESAVERNLQRLPFRMEDFSQRIEDLEREYIERSDAPDIEEIFRNWAEKIEAASADSIRQIEEIDSTLEGTAEKAKSHFLNDLNKVKGKVYRSVKDQERIQISRISKVQKSLYPNRNLQEREVAFLYFMNKYGIHIWQELLDNLGDLSVDTHKLIYL